MNQADQLLIPMLQVGLICLRLGALWMVFPFFSYATFPMTVRLAGMLTMALALHPSIAQFLPAWSLQNSPSLSVLMAFVFREFFVGIGMGFMARMMFQSIVSSAHWAGAQMGFSAGGLIDPDMQTDSNAWAEFLQMSAMMIFLSVGGHHVLVQALAQSWSLDWSGFLSRITDPTAGFEYWAEAGSVFFSWMLRLAAPLAIVVLLLQLGMGVLSKFVPQINIWLVSMPVTIGIGVLVFSFLSPMYGDVLSKVFTTQNEWVSAWIRFAGGR